VRLPNAHAAMDLTAILLVALSEIAAAHVRDRYCAAPCDEIVGSKSSSDEHR
jgi:hypothetical protein